MAARWIRTFGFKIKRDLKQTPIEPMRDKLAPEAHEGGARICVSQVTASPAFFVAVLSDS